MGDKTNIEWTDETWNPIVGCSVVSPGCTNCYAMKQAARIEMMHEGRHALHAGDGGVNANAPPTPYAGLTQASKAGPVWTGKVAMANDQTLTKPLRWKRGRRIFVNSMGDLFHESVPDAWIDRVFAVMALAPQHTFICLTKRAKRMREWAHYSRRGGVIFSMLDVIDERKEGGHKQAVETPWPLPNVVLGVSAEDQPRADERIPDLLATPAAKRIVSIEPMLGPIELSRFVSSSPLFGIDENRKTYVIEEGRGLDGVILGGESGPGARPMHPDWARSVRDQCAAASAPFFFKQWGEFREFDTGPPPHQEVDNDSESADAIYAAAINPSFVVPDGRHFARIGLPLNTPARLIERVGKARAGRLLDGRSHNDFPRSRA